MRYLKTYQLFESSDESYTDNIRLNIKDILLSLEDEGIHNDIIMTMEVSSILVTVGLLSIDFNDTQSMIRKPFDITNYVISTLKHLDGYLQSKGLKLSSISFRAKERDSDMQGGVLQNDGAETWEEFSEYLNRWGYHQFENLIIRYKLKV